MHCERVSYNLRWGERHTIETCKKVTLVLFAKNCLILNNVALVVTLTSFGRQIFIVNDRNDMFTKKKEEQLNEAHEEEDKHSLQIHKWHHHLESMKMVNSNTSPYFPVPLTFTASIFNEEFTETSAKYSRTSAGDARAH